MADAKTAQEVQEEMVKEPTLDRFFLENPHGKPDTFFLELIEGERRDREAFLQKEATK